MERPLLSVSLCLAVGALVGGDVGPGCAALLIGGSAGLLLLALVAPQPRCAAAALACAAVAVGAAGAGIERATYEAAPLLRWMAAQPEPPGPVLVRGIAFGDGREGAERFVLVVDVETLRYGSIERPVAGRVRVDIGGDARGPEILDGDRVSAWASLRLPRGFGNPGSFDVLAQARRDGVHLFGYCKSARLLTREGRGDVGWLRAGSAQARRWARARLAALVLPGAEQGLVRAMVLGDRSGLDPETEEAFRASGTYHVVAISGAQVALLAGLLLWPLRRLGVGPLPTALVVCLCLVFYAELVGGQIPVVRAAVMAIVVVLGRAFDLEADLVNLLGLAAALLLLVRPCSVGDVGFQLSFLATLGILILTPPLLEKAPRLPLRLEVALAASFAAQAALVTLLAWHFHRLAPAALLLNLAAVPLSGAVLVAGLGALAISVLASPLGPQAGAVAWIAAHALIRTGDLVRWLPALDVRVATPPGWVFGLHAAGLVAFPDARRRKRGLVLLGVAVVGLAVVGGAAKEADGRLHLTVLDVGQGDCLAIRSPRGRVLLVDAGGAAGGRFDFGEAVVGPYLWSQGIARLDGLVVTHAHPDHVGGVPFLLQAFRVGEVWEGPAPVADAPYAILDRTLRAARVERRTVLRGVRRNWDDVEIEVRGPRPRGRPPWTTRNDDSVVLSLRFGRVTFLLAGDIEAHGEAELGRVPAAVLKVPHHGSRTSSTPAFVAATSPRVAIVSAGFRNRFGHPHPDVLERYLSQGSLVFRTDRDGAVTVSTDGSRIWVATFRAGPGGAI